MVADIKKAFPDVIMRISSYEHDSADERLKAMIGPVFANFSLDSNQQRLNVRPTVEAIKNTRRLSGHMSTYDILAKYADGERFNPLTRQEKSLLVSRYEKDVASLNCITTTKPLEI